MTGTDNQLPASHLAPAHIMGIISYLAASVLLLFQIELSIIPLGIFLTTCFFEPIRLKVEILFDCRYPHIPYFHWFPLPIYATRLCNINNTIITGCYKSIGKCYINERFCNILVDMRGRCPTLYCSPFAKLGLSWNYEECEHYLVIVFTSS